MKKLSLLLSVIMLVTLSLAACGVKQPDFSPGEIENGVYTSEWLGLKFTPNEDMELANSDELEMLMNTGSDVYYIDEATGEEMLDYSKLSTVYDMLVTDLGTNGSILIMAQYMDEEMTVDGYIESLKEQMADQLAVEDLGEPTYDENKTEKLAGKKYTVFGYSLNSFGVELKQTMYIREAGDRLVNICFTYSTEEELNSFINCFSKN